MLDFAKGGQRGGMRRSLGSAHYFRGTAVTAPRNPSPALRLLGNEGFEI